MLRPSNTPRLLSLAIVFAIPTAVQAQTPAPAPKATPEAALVAKARAIHDRVITLDTHDDIGVNNFTFSRNYTQDLGNQVNLPKMKTGGLDAARRTPRFGHSRTSAGTWTMNRCWRSRRTAASCRWWPSLPT